MTTAVLRSLSVSITLETDEAVTSNILISVSSSELEKIRELQTEINGVITEKISRLKAENKLLEEVEQAEEEEECGTDDED